MELFDIIVGAVAGALASGAVAYPLGRLRERRDVQRQAASALEQELEALAAGLGQHNEWFEAWNEILTLRDRYEGRLRHHKLESRLEAITQLANFLLHRRQEEVPAGHRLPSTSSMYLAITSAREGLVAFLQHERLPDPSFPVGAALSILLERWQVEGERPAELRPSQRGSVERPRKLIPKLRSGKGLRAA